MEDDGRNLETSERMSSKDVEEFRRIKPRLVELLAQLGERGGDVRQRKEKLFLKICSGSAFTLLFFLLLSILGWFSCFWGLVVGGVSAVGVASVFMDEDKLREVRALQEAKKAVSEFCEKVQPLKDVEEEENLMQKTLHTENTEFRPEERLLQVTERCKDILKDLLELKYTRK